MNHPREPLERLFDRFNPCFASVAEQDALEFELRAGPNLGRALRFKSDPLGRGVFLELKHHWSRSDPADPDVTLAYGAWHRPTPPGFPLYFFSKVLFEGKLSKLETDTVIAKLKRAILEVKEISQEKVVQEGRLFTDWAKNSEGAGSYYQ